ncbi:MAG: hypothetical protein KDC85_11830 [Saprospiraceae bacterium]|nr:hypothetical protein [Saprospiraceae bacterium]MCB9326191.1 hypothetical protein [Lewinellaceae bacterium]
MEYVFSQLFPGEKFEEQQLHNVMSYLKKLYFRFLSIKYIEEQDFMEPLFTIESAYENNQFDLLKNRGKQVEKNLKKTPHQNNDYHYAQYRLNYLLGYYAAQYEDRTKSVLFQKMLNSLDRFYIIEKLRNSCHLTANMIMLNTNYDFHFLKELMQYLQDHMEDYREDLSIIMYYTILKSLQEEDNPDHYKKLIDILSHDVSRLSSEEQSDLYSFANNYCIRQINNGDSNYQRELFQLYEQGLKTGLILDNGILSEWNYKNITSLACSLKEFEWAENFIQTYKDKLNAPRRENAYNYNLAHLYYNKKMYSEALSVLLLVQFTDIKYHLNTTFLLLRTYFALKDTEAVLSLIETFRIYVIRNQKMTLELKRGYTNFLKFAKQLVLLKHHASTYPKTKLREKLDGLKTKIESTNNLINRYWLLEECDM